MTIADSTAVFLGVAQGLVFHILLSFRKFVVILYHNMLLLMDFDSNTNRRPSKIDSGGTISTVGRLPTTQYRTAGTNVGDPGRLLPTKLRLHSRLSIAG